MAGPDLCALKGSARAHSYIGEAEMPLLRPLLIVLAVAQVAIIGTPIAGPLPANAVVPGNNGRIAYVKDSRPGARTSDRAYPSSGT